ncbi:MAG: ABC transporter permease [Candidatus Bipolaricaulaceae bacterium]
MRPTLVFFWYSLKYRARYRGDFVWSIVAPVLFALPAIVLGYWGEQLGGLQSFVAATGTPQYVSYVLLGALYWNFVEGAWSVAYSLHSAMRSGVLESIFVTKLSHLGMILAWSGARLLGTTMHSALAIALLIGLAGWPGGVVIGQIALVLALSLLGSYGLSFILFGLTLRFRDADSLLYTVSNIAPLLGGVFFPIYILPSFMRPFSLAFPFTYGLDALRALWLRGRSILPLPDQLALLGALAVAYLVLGWWSMKHFELLSRRHGLEGF